ncbi:MAG TPA: DUF4097 family beta strand repeat-containing protein [Gemmatimonadales bacterium]|nr:DUF4097 family beta strand repeat-containing protein [Gemmatimonadales bacterium]
MSSKSFQYLGLTASIFALAGAAGGPISPANAHSQKPETVSLTGAKVGIWNLVGQVTVVPAGAGTAVVVEITRRGKDAAKITTAQGELGGAQTLRLVYPAADILYRPAGRTSGEWESDLRVRDDGTFGDEDRWGGGHRVRISSDGGIDAAADLTVRVPRGQRITIRLAVGAITAENVDGDLKLDTDDGDIATTKTRGNLVLDTGSGNVKLTGHDGDASIDTGSGDVTASAMHGHDLSFDTGSGDVSIDGAAADALSVDTGSGAVTVSGLASGRVKVDTGSGDVELAYADAPTDIDIDAGSGNVRITSPAGLNARVDFETSSGDITTDFPVTLTSHERDELHGTIGTGGGRLHVETGSGNIELRKK